MRRFTVDGAGQATSYFVRCDGCFVEVPSTVATEHGWGTVTFQTVATLVVDVCDRCLAKAGLVAPRPLGA